MTVITVHQATTRMALRRLAGRSLSTDPAAGYGTWSGRRISRSSKAGTQRLARSN